MSQPEGSVASPYIVNRNRLAVTGCGNLDAIKVDCSLPINSLKVKQNSCILHGTGDLHTLDFYSTPHSSFTVRRIYEVAEVAELDLKF